IMETLHLRDSNWIMTSRVFARDMCERGATTTHRYSLEGTVLDLTRPEMVDRGRVISASAGSLRDRGVVLTRSNSMPVSPLCKYLEKGGHRGRLRKIRQLCACILG